MRIVSAARRLCGAAASIALLALALALAPSTARADGATIVVSLSLSKYGSVETTDAGPSAGVRPAVVHASVGDRIVFVDDDTDHHTATALAGQTAFIEDPRWTDEALHPGGAIGPGFWSTGDLAPGQRSAPLYARKAGTYLYGCFFDYGAGMRGVIVVSP